MPSTLGWIDYDVDHQESMRRVLAFFRERESRDELGLGAIRDAIADKLLPGTSTLQTRLRYMRAGHRSQHAQAQAARGDPQTREPVAHLTPTQPLLLASLPALATPGP